ncbi:hypothetical protein WK35_03590 [Burkholderia vietnamiensis]|nr:hypothetical protein WK29_00085 [Burkholderia vietnamiensis]KVS03668.1 hypothetical protein WK32_15755 [Burkholderia vietnamiensis]KVS35682.1 hypothetical protein WK35_03590 [Burkholderia vietnamiensis]
MKSTLLYLDVGMRSGHLLDHLQRHQRQARLTAFLYRRLQLRLQHRRTVAQRSRDQVVAHRTQRCATSARSSASRSKDSRSIISIARP